MGLWLSFPTSCLDFHQLKRHVKGRLPVQTSKELSSSLTFSMSTVTIFPVMFQEGCTFFDLPFLSHMPSETSSLFFASLVKLISSCSLASLTSSWHKVAMSLYSSYPYIPCLCIFFFPCSLTIRSGVICADILSSFPDFLHVGIESSCTLWKAFLKICQLWSAPSSLKTVFQGILLNNSLNSWKVAFLNWVKVWAFLSWAD